MFIFPAIGLPLILLIFSNAGIYEQGFNPEGQDLRIDISTPNKIAQMKCIFVVAYNSFSKTKKYDYFYSTSLWDAVCYKMAGIMAEMN